MPCTMAAIAITVATPITTPRIVSAERILLARSVSRASVRFWRSRSPRITGSLRSLRAHRDHRVEPRRARRRVDAEEDADAGAEGHGQRHGPGGHTGREGRGERNERR